MEFSEFVILILQNPLALGAIIAFIWNIGGYISASARAKKLEAYDKNKLIETLALFETVMLITQGVAGLPTSWATTISIIVNVVVSLKKALSQTK